MSNPNCMECNSVAELVTGKDIYPHRTDLHHKAFYKCVCGAYCGCHEGTKKPLGYPANAITRKARSAAHKEFDKLWKNNYMSRVEAYKWLQETMNLSTELCHIGMMNLDQASKVYIAARQYMSTLTQVEYDNEMFN